jgi:hypothetical protein
MRGETNATLSAAVQDVQYQRQLLRACEKKMAELCYKTQRGVYPAPGRGRSLPTLLHNRAIHLL